MTNWSSICNFYFSIFSVLNHVIGVLEGAEFNGILVVKFINLIFSVRLGLVRVRLDS